MTTRKLIFSCRYVMKNTRLPTMIGRNAPIIVKSINNHISIRNFSQEAKSDKVQQLTEEILKLSNLEMNQLISALQTRLGVSDDALKMAGSGSGGGGGGAQKSAAVEEAAEPEPVKVKEAFGVKIASVDPKNKLKVIKEIRTLIEGLPIKEAKELVEKAPVVVKEGLKKEEAEKFKKVLTDAGAVIELI